MGIQLSVQMKTYSEKLRDPRWQRKRLEAMQNDDFTCQHCGDSKSTLNVHHAYYGKGKEPWEYQLSELVTLCERCHKNIERIRDLVGVFIQNPEGAWAVLNLIILTAKCGPKAAEMFGKIQQKHVEEYKRTHPSE